MKPDPESTPVQGEAAIPRDQAVPPAERSAAPDRRRFAGSRIPGEAYTPMPDLLKSGRPRWVYFAAVAVLAMVLALGMAYIRKRPPPAEHALPAAQSVTVDAPAAATGGETDK